MDSQEIKKIYNYGVNFIAINCYWKLLSNYIAYNNLWNSDFSQEVKTKLHLINYFNLIEYMNTSISNFNKQINI